MSPSYPSDSLAFLQQHQDGTKSRIRRSNVTLSIIIAGAGLGGLATACALARRGHNVTVFEQSSQLGEVRPRQLAMCFSANVMDFKVGAGIQMPPNSARLLLSWGLGEFLEQKVVEPTNIKFRRWKTGTEIGCTKLVPNHRQDFDAPYYVIHRAHFHEALHALALKSGANIKIASKVVEYNPEMPSITLQNSEIHTADLVIAADGR